MRRPAPAKAVRDSAVLTRALLRAAALLGFSQAELAEVLGTSPASVSRTAAGAREIDPRSAEGRTALLLLRLFRSLDTLVGGDSQKARLWLEADNLHLGGVPPRDRLTSPEGLVHVVDHLDALRGSL